jgi:lantibiotic modifying enzyme
MKVDGVSVFNKPRSVFWELFFFGQKSPLRQIFASTSIQMNLTLQSSNGNFDNNIIGIERSNRNIETADYYAFGQLLAYSYYFGFQDLHKDNLLITTNGLQVIDLEQAFAKLLLPNQTLLLPANKNITWSAGLNVLTKSKIDQLALTEAKALIDGFVDLSELFLNNLQAIQSILSNEIINFEKQPIRLFYRATKDYVEKLKGTSSITNWFPEEIEQLERGDVPYFFINLGSEKAYCYSSLNWTQKEVQTPAEFHKFSNFCGKNPLDLFNREGIVHQWACGMLFLTKKLTSLSTVELNWPSCSISKINGELIFISNEMKMTAKL